MRVILCLSAALATALSNPAHSEQLTIATWNLEHFSGADGTGCNPRNQSSYDDIRRIINAVDADIWLFQEVDTIGSLARIMDTTGWRLRSEGRTDRVPPGKCQSGGNDQTMQKVVTAVNKRIPIRSERELSFLDTSGYGALRHGLSTTVFLNSQPVVVVNIHLKAGCIEGDASEACATLFEQIPYLTAYAAQQANNDLPVIIGGDFNRRLAIEGDAAMNTLAFNKHLGLTISSHDSSSKCSLQNKQPIDYQLVSSSFAALLKDVDAYEHSFNGPFEEWPSDHCPSVVRYTF